MQNKNSLAVKIISNVSFSVFQPLSTKKWETSQNQADNFTIINYYSYNHYT